jgi:surface protein
MEKNPYEKNKYLEKHQHLNVSQAELERKWRLYEEEQELMKLMMGASAPGNAYSVPFISTWRTSIVYSGSTADNKIKLPLMPDGSYNFYVNWGDGTFSSIVAWNQPETTHTYPAPGDYTVTITGAIRGWNFGGGGSVLPTTGDMRKLLTITQWGCLRFVEYIGSALLYSPFYGCTNLTLLTVTDTPNFEGTRSVVGFLRGCTSITTINNINKWDVANVTYFRSMFRECSNFNDNVGNWNVSNATSIALMFYGNSTAAPYGVFNNGGSDSIKNWDTRNVTDMIYTFGIQPSFNQPVGDWNVSSVTDMQQMFNSYWNGALGTSLGTFTNGNSNSIETWNTGNVTNMNGMFSGQGLFNRNIGGWNMSKVTNTGYMLQSLNFNNGGSSDINNWDVSKVTTMSRMFQSAFNFNQPLNNWKVPLVTDFVNFMNESGVITPYAFSVTNYSNFLIALAAQSVKPNVSLRVNQYYNSSAVAARAVLAAAPNNWTFVDKGLQP